MFKHILLFLVILTLVLSLSYYNATDVGIAPELVFAFWKRQMFCVGMFVLIAFGTLFTTGCIVQLRRRLAKGKEQH